MLRIAITLALASTDRRDEREAPRSEKRSPSDEPRRRDRTPPRPLKTNAAQ